jgi:hypothetical protein
MATWWELTFTGEPTESDFARVSEMTAQGFTSGQLINAPGDELTEGPATGYCAPGDGEGYTYIGKGHHRHRCQGQTLRHAHAGGSEPHGYYDHPEDNH